MTTRNARRTLSAMRTLSRAAWIRPALLLGTVLPFVLPAHAQAPSAPAQTSPPAPSSDAGVWQKHEYSFDYMGFTTTYSCDGLADKLKRLLIAAGARADVKSVAGACASGFGRPDKFARAYLTFYTLAPYTPATGATAAANGASSSAAPVPGIWRSVTFTPHSPRELATGDCELIEQFRDHILPMFTTRNATDRTTCIPNQLSGSDIDMQFQSFAAAPPALAAAGR